jgi:hypothetical protein
MKLFTSTIVIVSLVTSSCVQNNSSVSNSTEAIISSVNPNSSSFSSEKQIINEDNFKIKEFRKYVSETFHKKEIIDRYLNSKILSDNNEMIEILANEYFIFMPPQPAEGFSLPYILRFPLGNYASQNKDYKKYLVLADFGSPENEDFDFPIAEYVKNNLRGSLEVNYANSNWSAGLNRLDLPTISPMIARKCLATDFDQALNQHLDRETVFATFENRNDFKINAFCGNEDEPFNISLSEEDFVAIEDVELQVKNQIEHAIRLLNEFNYKLEEKIIMLGYSTTGAFVQRFATIYPELIKVYYAGGTAMPILPSKSLKNEELIYPLGVAEHKELFGRDFNLEHYNKIAKINALSKYERRLDAVDYFIWDKVQKLFTGPLNIWGDHSRLDKEIFWNDVADAFYSLGGEGMFFFNLETAHYVSENDKKFIFDFIELNLNSKNPVYPKNSDFKEHIIRLG